MASIFQKVRNITLGNVHTLLDGLQGLNDIGSIEQYVRDLEEARKDLEGTLAEARYDLRTKENNLSTHTHHAADLETQIRTLANAGGDQNVTSARILAVELAALRPTIQTEEVQVTEQRENVDKLREAVAGVNVQESQAKSKLGQLRSASSGTKAKEHAATALEAVGNVLESGGSIDSAIDRVGRRGARADAAFERAIGGLPNQSANMAAADAILAELTAPKTQP